MSQATITESTLPLAPPTRDRSRLIHGALLAAILIFAAAVRLHGLTAQSFWYDEALTAKIVQTSWPGLLHEIIHSEQTPPLIYIVLKIFTTFTGLHDWSLRLPEALLGVASIWLLYQLCAYCIGKTEALIAAALMAASPYHIWYSQEVRAYVLLLALALWSCNEFVRMLDEPRRWQRELRYWIVTVMLLYTHLYAPLVIASQVICYAARRISGKPTSLSVGRFAQLLLAAFVVWGMWWPALRHWFKLSGSSWKPLVHASDIPVAYSLYIGWDNLLLMAVICALVVIGCARPIARRWLGLILPLALLPVMVPAIAATLLPNLLWTHRYGIVAMSGFLILLASGIAALPRFACVIVTIGLAALMLAAPNHQPKDPWREAVAWISDHAQSGDYVMVNDLPEVEALRHYLQRTDLKTRAFFGTAIWIGVPLPKPTMHLWLVLSRPRPEGSGVEIINRGNWRVCSQKAFGRISVFELADGATTPEAAYPDEIRFNAKPPTTDRSPP